jgi:glycosyltransferase involved in cell wall biosynthesis
VTLEHAPSFGVGKRILIVTPQPFYEDRGTPIALRLVIQALTELGYAVDILAFPMGQTLTMQGLKIRRIANPLRIRTVPIGFSWRKLTLDFILLGELRRLLAVEHYDCLHAVEEAAYPYPLLRRHGTPFVYDMASSIPTQLTARAWFSSAWVKRALRMLERQVLKRAAYVLCSKGLEDEARATAEEAAIEPWDYPPTSEPDWGGDPLALRRRFHIPASAKVVLYAGSFAEYQGLDVLIDAIPLVHRKMPEVYFVCVGGTQSEIATLEARLHPTARPVVRLVERQSNADVGSYLACANVLISTRVTGANLPLKVFDYLATGKPILVSRCEAHASVLHHPQVRAFDHETHSLVHALTAVLQGEGHAAASAEEMRAHHAEHWHAFKRQLARIYEKVILEHELRETSPTR